MSNLKISQLPEFTGNTSGSYLVMNNSGETTTYKVKKENYLFPYNGNAAISGSLTTSGSLTVSGSAVGVGNGLNVIGNTQLSGSLFIHGTDPAGYKFLFFGNNSGSAGGYLVYNPSLNSGTGQLALYVSGSGETAIGLISGRNTIAGNTRHTGSLTVTGSVNISTVMTLAKQNPLPTGTTGSLAVSGSNLFFNNGTSWTQII